MNKKFTAIWVALSFAWAMLNPIVTASEAQAQSPQPHWIAGDYTIAAGPDNLVTNLPPAVYKYYEAWATDRPGGAGYMVSNGSAWVTNQGATGANGATGPAGADGAAGVNAFGSPTTRTLSLATAYQATNTDKPAMVTINLTSTANLSLSGGTTNSATILMGSTNGVASGTGTIICPYSNSSTGTLTIGLNTNTISTLSCAISLPAGWYFAVRVQSGAVTITSAFDQAVG